VGIHCFFNPPIHGGRRFRCGDQPARWIVWDSQPGVPEILRVSAWVQTNFCCGFAMQCYPVLEACWGRLSASRKRGKAFA
jgi:hypothetical protein